MLLDQQLAAEPAPSALDVTLPERGLVLTFTRSLQVDGGTPLALTLQVAPARRTSTGWLACVLAAAAILGALTFPRRTRAAA